MLARRRHAATFAALVASILVNPTQARAGIFVANCTDGSGNGSQLATALATANASEAPDQINLATGCTYAIFNTLQVTGTSPVTITGGAGEGATIDAQGLAQVVHVATGAKLTLDHVTITGGAEPTSPFGGGGIRNRGTLTLLDVTVRGNYAEVNGGGISNAGTMTIERSTFTDNSTGIDGLGGAIDNLGTVTMRRSEVRENSAGTSGGGGISNKSDGSTTIYGSSIADNETTGMGGGIFNKGGQVTVLGSTISSNTALVGGGMGNAEVLSVQDSDIVANSAGAGGGIYNSGVLTVTGTRLAANVVRRTPQVVATSQGGGGIYNINVPTGPGKVTVTDSSFDGNRAVHGGGLINVGGGSYVSLADSSFTANDADVNGGGLYNHGRVDALRTVFSGNDAVRGGGAVFTTNQWTKITDSHFLENSASRGGAVYNHSETTITRSVLSGNLADIGGGIFAALRPGGGSGVKVYDSTLSENLAMEGGGAVYAEDDVTVERSTVSDNRVDLTAVGKGAGVWVAGNGTLNMTNSTVSANRAPFGHGGGLYVSTPPPAVTVTVWNSTIAFNAALDGGGIFRATGRVSLRNSIVALNSPSNCIGALWTGQTNLSNTATCGPVSAGFATPPPAITLGPLAYNGGPTKTHALPDGSPAIAAAGATCPQLDQRGDPRTTPSCDIGALEHP